MRTALILLTTALAVAPVAAHDDHEHPPAAEYPRLPVRAGTDSGQDLHAPAEADEFSFVIYGDRTGGQPSGIRVLEEAVRMTNRLDPAFVMTVGDLVQGYNDEVTWLGQMREYKDTVAALNMPWYPVVGNHDIYDEPRTAEGHTELYKQHFGPLYYSFDYKWAHFVCLFSDEAMSFSNPAVNQNMGSEQMQWLRDDLSATSAEQVFVFLHHPRWNYVGCNWPDVHRLLADDGRVVAVIGGHVHEYRDDGVRDGIHYYTMATTGAERTGLRESASFDHINLVRVRRDRMAMCALPVGSVLGGDVVLGREVDEIRDLGRGRWVSVDGAVDLAVDEPRTSHVSVTLRNPTDRPLAFTGTVGVPEGWTLSGRAAEGTIEPGAAAVVDFDVTTSGLRSTPEPRLRLAVVLDYVLASGLRQPVRAAVDVPVHLRGLEPLAAATPDRNGVLDLDGRSAVRVDLGAAADDLGALTLEGWVRGNAPAARCGLLAKTENSAFGIFWSESGMPMPAGYVNLEGVGYVTARPQTPWTWDEWTHLALVYDGARAVLYVNGEPGVVIEQAGRVTSNRMPLYVGADPDGRGRATSFFTGQIDEVRLSRVARYEGPFTPAPRHRRDDDTLLLLHFDAQLHGVFPDDSGRAAHGWAVGDPRVVEAAR